MAPRHGRTLVVLCTLALLAGAPAARAETLRIPPGFALAVKVPGTDARGNFTAIVGDPKIADVVYGPQNAFMFVGKSVGATNIVVLDNTTGAEIYNATLLVGAGSVVNVRIYVGMGEGRGYLCRVAECVPERSAAN